MENLLQMVYTIKLQVFAVNEHLRDGFPILIALLVPRNCFKINTRRLVLKKTVFLRGRVR